MRAVWHIIIRISLIYVCTELMIVLNSSLRQILPCNHKFKTCMSCRGDTLEILLSALVVWTHSWMLIVAKIR
ncbi:hypothetical protein EDC01DRAFT_667818 [Geopyxis carbonaria]|nr:hypothetical protein EDC01DRAFT_667818 [Geopyxis carbonaria]